MLVKHSLSLSVSGNVFNFILLFEGQFCLKQNTSLQLFFFSFQHYKYMFFHCILVFTVSYQKSVLIVQFSLSIHCVIFSFTAFNIVFVFKSFNALCVGRSLCVYLLCNSLDLIDKWIIVFHQVWEHFGHHIFKQFSVPFSASTGPHVTIYQCA